MYNGISLIAISILRMRFQLPQILRVSSILIIQYGRCTDRHHMLATHSIQMLLSYSPLHRFLNVLCILF